ncbi:MAG: acyl-homoserine-lactone synthase [Sedimentitalea sp.]|uniref:acyl-homoserine-lactone synthase n=1 Tax=Sedimentitalea sp. TaxID=2048915 RepID=UPI0032663BE9
MIIVIDGINRHRYTRLLDEMYELRARVFGQRLGWEVEIEDGKEIDQFDSLDPAYVIGLNDNGRVVSCVRALQTTGPHMLSDVFSDILDGEPPLRGATIWESTRFCVDTDILERGTSRNSVSYATCELMAGSLEYARNSGISDIVTVIDPVMNRVLRRSDCAPYGYVGSTKPMGKVSAMAALLDCTDDRIDRIRKFAGIEGEIFVDRWIAKELADPEPPVAETSVVVWPFGKQRGDSDLHSQLEQYCLDQLLDASTQDELEAAKRLTEILRGEEMIRSITPHLPAC